MRILFLPLDERPCNRVFPEMMENEKLTLVTCEKKILGDKKKPGDTDEISHFLLDNADHCDYAVISLDTLLYGGLLPSRLHHEKAESLEKRLSVLSEMKKKNPDLKIYAFQCIMRCPQYSSAEEEPDYYEQYGLSIFRQEYLCDKMEREGITEEEQKELSSIVIPDKILEDYRTRRKINVLLRSVIRPKIRRSY